jgi:hypothetical protein
MGDVAEGTAHDEAAEDLSGGADKGMSMEAVEEALKSLRAEYGSYYTIVYTAKLGWCATRHGQARGVITAESPGELREEMAAGLRRVRL